MKQKLELLSNIIKKIGYDELKRKDYVSCGFSDIESDTCMSIYYSIANLRELINIDISLPFAENVTNETTDPMIKYYFMCFIVKHARGNNKYSISKKLIIHILKNKELIINFYDNIFVERETLNYVLSISSNMMINLIAVLELIYEYVLSMQDLFYFFSGTISHALKRVNSEKINSKFQTLYEQIVGRYTYSRNVFGLQEIMDKLIEEKNRFFDTDIIHEPLYELYLELGQEGVGIREVTYLQSAVEGFHLLKNNSCEQKALGLLQYIIENNDIQWHEAAVQMPKEFKKIIIRNIERLTEHLKHNNLADIIRGIGKYVVYQSVDIAGNIVHQDVIYEPYPSHKTIVDSKSTSITLQLFTTFTLSDNRISSTEGRETRMFKDIFYENHLKVFVMPLMEWLDTNNISLLCEIRSLMHESIYVDKETYKYYLKVEKYYAPQSAFEFINMSVILIEKILRQMYKELKGTNITTQRRNFQTQFNVNLQDIMGNSQFQEFLGTDLYHYLHYILIDDEGLNLRNNALHGFLKIEGYHHYYSRILMHSLLLILNHELKY